MKRNFRRIFALVLAVSMLLSLAACGGTSASSSASQQPADQSEPSSASDKIALSSQEFISLGGGVSGGTYAMIGAAMATVLTNNIENLSVNCEGTSGSVEACKLVGSGDLAFALSASDAFYTAGVGEGSFEGAPVEGLRIVMGGYSAPFHIIVREDSNIYSMEDLKGKRITASAGNTIQNQLPIIMAAYGYAPEDYTAVPLSQSEGADALKDGNVDVIMQTTSVGASAYTDLTNTIKCRFISMDEEHINKIHEAYPYITADNIPAGSYPNQDEEIKSITTTNFLITSADVSDELVYAVTKALHVHNDELAEIHYLGEEFNPEFTVTNAPIEIHPGAVQYYKEIGAIQ